MRWPFARKVMLKQTWPRHGWGLGGKRGSTTKTLHSGKLTAGRSGALDDDGARGGCARFDHEPDDWVVAQSPSVYQPGLGGGGAAGFVDDDVLNRQA
jgi:hypothetical protein